MKKLALLGFFLAACASAPRSQPIDHALLEGYTVEQVREAALTVLEENAPAKGTMVRATAEGALAEGRIGVCGRDVACGSGTLDLRHNTGTPWTTIHVRLPISERIPLSRSRSSTRRAGAATAGRDANAPWPAARRSPWPPPAPPS